MLLWEKIQFISWDFPLVAMFRSSDYRPRQFVSWNILTVVFPISVSSMQSSLLPSPFIDANWVSLSSFWCTTLRLVINFLVLWSFCLSSFFVHFKNAPEYFTRKTSQVFILWMKFLLQNMVLRSFLFLLNYSFLIFFFFSFIACLIMSASNIPQYL